MSDRVLIANAWNNGQHNPTGAGYGLKIKREDRDRHFDRAWPTVHLGLPDGRGPVEVNIAKRSFWDGSCRELIHKDLGRWLRTSGLAPWPRGRPPKLRLVRLGDRRFWLEAGGG